VDEHEELGRWIARAQAELARLPATSHERRQQELVIRRMELAQLRYSIDLARDRLARLPTRSDDSRRLSAAIDRMEDERQRGWHELLTHLESRGAVKVGEYQRVKKRDLEEARQALRRAWSSLMQPTADVGQAIVELERALARLKDQSGR
jgi:hypothetical protein